MFARVITAHADPSRFAEVIALAERQLPGARERPGFAGYELLCDETSGRVIITSYWETREQMEQVSAGTADGVHDKGQAAVGLSSVRLETYEIRLRIHGGGIRDA